MEAVVTEKQKNAPIVKKPTSGKLATRLITGFLLAGISIIIIIWNKWPFFLEIFILGIIGINEFCSLAEKKGIRPSRTNAIASGCILLAFPMFGNEENVSAVIAGLCLITMLGYIFRKGFHVSSFLDVGVTILGYLYMGWFFSFLIFMRDMPGPQFAIGRFYIDRGAGFILLLIFATHLTDVGAFFAGKSFGKYKLAPHISPKKTIEGAIAGLFGAVCGAMLIGSLLGMNVADLIAIGLLCGVFAQLGDLWASILKRDVNVKDSGKIFAGHGGVLDRFDSLLFTTPVIYYYLKFFYI